MKPSGYALAEYRSKKQGSWSALGAPGGCKEQAPIPGSWPQAKRLERLLVAQSEIVDELRVAKRKQLAHGTLRDGHVVVTGPSGAYWRFVGFSQHSRNLLWPEEAVYLMESSCLEVFHNSLPLSGERLYSWMLSHIRMEEFVTYSHLMRLGYVVRRHQAESGLSDYERKINIHPHQQPGKKRKRSTGQNVTKIVKLRTENESGMNFKAAADSVDTDDSVCLSNNTDGSVSTEWNRVIECTGTVDDIGESGDYDVNGRTPDQCECQVEMLLELRGNSADSRCDLYNYTVGNVADFLDRDMWSVTLGSKGDRGQASPPGPRLAPPLTQASPPGPRLAPPPRQACWPDSPPVSGRIEDSRSFTVTKDKSLSKAKNWQQYQTILNYVMQSSEAPTDYLWDDDVVPLNSPETVKTLTEIRHNLQIVKSVTDFKPTPAEVKFDITYDLYTPAQKSTFKKSGVGQVPAYRVVVMGEGSRPPELVDVVRTRCTDGVPLLWAVTDNSCVQFYAFEHVEIADDF